MSVTTAATTANESEFATVGLWIWAGTDSEAENSKKEEALVVIVETVVVVVVDGVAVVVVAALCPFVMTS